MTPWRCYLDGWWNLTADCTACWVWWSGIHRDSR